MAFLEWDDSYSVDIAEIDRHHQHLFGLVSQLHEAIERSNRLATLESVLREQETVAAVIEELINYASYHFTTEEDYMRRWAYPEHGQHRDEHRQFRDHVQAFRQSFSKKKTRLSLDIAEFAKSWCQSHILVTDKKCGAFLKEQGVK